MNEEQAPQVTETRPTQDWKHHFTTVTPLSKILAMALFISLPFVGFWLGVRYGASDSNQLDMSDVLAVPASDERAVGEDNSADDLSPQYPYPPAPPSTALPIPDENPDPSDNLNTGPIDGNGDRLYRSDGFSFEFKYPSTFIGDHWLLSSNDGVLDRVGVEFADSTKDDRIRISILVSRSYGAPHLCSMCDPSPNEYVSGLLGGYPVEILPRHHYVSLERQGVTYQIAVYELSGTRIEEQDLIFNKVIESFNFF